MEYLRNLFNRKSAQIDYRMNWPTISGAKVIGMLSGSGEVNYPDDFQGLTTVKNIDDLSSNYLPDKEFGFGAGAGVHVIGKTRTGYVLSAYDKGNPVFVVDKEKVESLGFDPNKYNFEDLP